MPLTFGGLTRTETFTFSNDTGTDIEVTLLDTAQQPLASVSGSQSSLELNVDTTGGEQFLFTIRRSSLAENGFACFWLSPISYLALDRPIGFYVSDESGPDWLGDDEILLDIFVDTASLFSGSWDDADTGERWPGLVEAIRGRLGAALPGMRRLPFTDNVTLSYVEEDISASGWLTQSIAPLAAADSDEVNRRLALPISDTLSDGFYTFYYSMSRFPE
jgi:hypothetical protein